MKVIFKLFLFGVLLSVKTPGFTQQSLADSLSKVLKSAKEDTGRVNTLNLLCRTFWLRGDYDSAQKIADESLSLSSKLKFKKGNADALVCMGLIKMEQGDYAKALENLFAGLKIFDSLGLKGKVASVYNNIGLTYSQRGNYSESLKNYFLSLKISKELNSKSEIASCYNNISIVYKVQGNLMESLKSEFEALKIYDQLFATPLPEKDRISNKSGQANIYGNMGNIFTLQHNYSDALKSFISSRKIFEEIGNKTGLEKTYIGSGTIYFYMGDETTSSPKKRDSLLQQALSDYMKTLSITRETGNKKDEATACGNIGNVYHNLGNISEAMKYYMMDLKSSEEAGDKDNIATSCVNIGAIYLKQKKYLDAEKYYNKALSVSKEMGDAEGMMDCYEGLSIVDSAKGDFKSALLHYKMQSIYKDSLQNEENTKKTVRL
ncbi:MAG TPA: tetratricopeptide repeat protein, partial [Bacteroidia bacterium]